MALALALALLPRPAATLVFGGDVALGRVVGEALVPIGGDDPLAGVAAVLAPADLAVVNLECALAERVPDARGVRLVARPEAAGWLARAGVDVVSLANNHTLDAGVAGIASTSAALAAVAVDALGTSAHTLVRTTAGGVRVAFMAVTDRVNATTPVDERRHVAWSPSVDLYTRLPERVARWREATPADVHVVLLHWGAELAPGPSRAQVGLARRLVDAGATLVVGHGAHVVQPMERYRGGVIFYSLGNLLFDMDTAATRRGALARVQLAAGVVVAAELVAIVAGPDDAPRLP